MAATARLDPLIPDLTDTPGNLEPLLSALHEAGVTAAAASYLFLRPAFARRLIEQLQQHQLAPSAVQTWSWQAFADDHGGGRMPGAPERRKRLARLSELAAPYGIEVQVCACKNPDLGGPGCRIAGGALARFPGEDHPTLFA